MLPFPPDPQAFKTLARVVPLWRAGAVGPLRKVLARTAADAAGSPEHGAVVTPFFVSLLEWAWQEEPMEPTYLNSLLAVQEQLQTLTPAARMAARHLRQRMDALPPADEALQADWEECAEADAATLAARMHDPARLAHPLFVNLAFNRLLDMAAWDEARRLLEALRRVGALPGLLVDRLTAEWAMSALPPAEAAPFVDAVDPEAFGAVQTLWRGELAIRMGDLDAACTTFLRFWTHAPWLTNLTLVLHDLLFPPPPPPASTAQAARESVILLYSWNKAAVLDQALTRLKATALHGALVIVLDNGSTDETNAVLTRHAETWPQGRFLHEATPVNIGAPAGRNWLLAKEAAQQAPFVVFFDDDALPESDAWLERLIAVAGRHPEAGAVGCRVTDALPPWRLQAADIHLQAPNLRAPHRPEQRIIPVDNGLGRRDPEFFAYERPCASVTGCCHLLPRTSLAAVGGFDVRFNPSQFDDLERDLRCALVGRPVVYCGHVLIRHMQHSSMNQASDAAKRAHIQGNKLKLESCFSDAEVHTIHRVTQEAAMRDLLQKSRAVAHKARRAGFLE